jgi:Zn-dependent protease with chaperone function
MRARIDSPARETAALEWLALRPWWARIGGAWLWTFPAALALMSLLTCEVGALESEELAIGPGEHLLVHALHTPAAHLTLLGLTAVTMISWHLWLNTESMRRLYAARLQPSPVLLEVANGLVPHNRLFALADTRLYAACVGLWRPAIYVSSGLLDALTPAQARAILAHEESHRLRRDPLRLFICRAIGRLLATVPWAADLVARVELRAEIRADRFARAATKRAHLATALLCILRATAGPHGPPSGCERTASPSFLAAPPAVTLPLRASGNAALVEERIRYLLLPEDSALPSVLARNWIGAATLTALVAGLSQAVTANPAMVVTLHHSLLLLPALLAALRVALYM